MTHTHINDGLNSLNAGLVPARDKNQTTSYVVPAYNRQQLTAMWRTSIAGRIVDQRAEDSFRKWREWQAKGRDISAIEKREKVLGLKSKLEQAQKIANCYGMAYVLINIRGQDHSEPLDLNTIKRGSILSVTVLERGEVGEGPEVLDALSEYYKTPEYFTVLTNNTDNMVDVHPSRVMVFFGNKRLDQWGGDSVLERVMTALIGYDATIANIMSLIWEAKIDVLTIKGLADAMRDPNEEREIMQRLNAAMFAKGNNGALILDADGETYEQKKMSFAGLTDIWNKCEDALASVVDMPLSILFKRQESGLGGNGGMSKEDYYNSVNSDQVNVIEPTMTNLDECLIRDALGSRPDDIWFSWVPLWSMSEKDVAEIGKTVTETYTTAYEKGIVDVNVANKAWVNRMTEVGAANGLEALNSSFIGSISNEEEPDIEV